MPVPSFHDVASFNERLLQDCLDLSEGKRHYRLGTPELELFGEDREALSPLPPAAFSCVRWETRRCSKQGTFTLGGVHRYSAGPAYARCEVAVALGAFDVTVCDISTGEAIATYERQWGGAPTDSSDPTLQLRLLCMRPAGWRDSSVRASLPEELVAFLDGEPADSLKADLRVLRDESAERGWEAAVEGMSRSLAATGSLDRATVALSAARDREAILYQFSSHEVQLITADLIGTEPITATGNISYEDADTTVLQFLGFNTARAPFQDSAARRALGLGINRETLVSAVLSGHARAAQFPVSPVSPLYPAELESLYSYDDFAAAMEAAGLNTGRTRTVTLLVNQENTFKVSAAEHIAQALSDFDLQIQVEALPWEEYAAALAAGNFDLYYGEVRLPANWDLSALVGTGGSLNYGGWADPQTEQLLAACAAAEDRAAALSDLCAYLQQQAPILPLCFKSSSVLYQTGAVSGLTPTAAEPFYDLPSCQIHLRQP